MSAFRSRVGELDRFAARTRSRVGEELDRFAARTRSRVGEELDRFAARTRSRVGEELDRFAARTKSTRSATPTDRRRLARRRLAFRARATYRRPRHVPFVLQTSIALPTREELLALLPDLLEASGALVPRDPAIPLFVYEHLSPAWSNVDFEPELEAFSELDRAFVERQIERTHRDDLLGRARSVVHLEGIPLAGPSLFDDETSWEVLLLEVPVLTVDRTHAVLRGQRQSPHDAEDFEHHLVKEDGRWTRRR